MRYVMKQAFLTLQIRLFCMKDSTFKTLKHFFFVLFFFVRLATPLLYQSKTHKQMTIIRNSYVHLIVAYCALK
jgi:hypothetical protein